VPRYGANVSRRQDGAKIGVVSLGVTSAQGGFAMFFIQLRKRAKRAHDAELEAEWAQLQKKTGES
jgi:hypothetical protein